MKISREWLTDYIDLGSIPDAELEAKLTEIGHNVESAESDGTDRIFDIEFTTNRIDAMSHFGLARELHAATKRALKPLQYARKPAETSPAVAIRIESPELCTRYTGLIIRGVNVKPSSGKIRKRLEAIGLRPINNIVDVTNYVMWAVGHPLHAFDLAKIQGSTIVARRGRSGETLKSLDGVDRTIDAETIVIADANRAVALGGIIGGANSEIGDSTRDILLECAHFAPSVIRRARRRLGITTDASYRFERGVDPDDTVVAIELAATLVLREAGGDRGGPIDVVAVPPATRTIRLRESKLREASANEIDIAFARALLERLGMRTADVAEGIEVTIPTWRSDLSEEMDLIEEALRMYGFNNIPPSLPRVSSGDVRANTIGDAEEKLRDILVGSGLTEVISYSFIHPDENRRFSSETALGITNLLTENISSMRLSLFPGLLQSAAHNRSYGIRDGAIFEVGRTYHSAEAGIRERYVAAIAMFGSVTSSWNEAKRSVDFFDAKGVVEAIAARFHVALSFAPAERPWLKNGQASIARGGDREIATLGFASREVLSAYDIKGDAALAEIDLQNLLAAAGDWQMAPVSRFPGVPMVLGLLHSPDLPYQKIVDAIRTLEIPHLADIGVWDRFVPGDGTEVKTALGMWYQAFDRSLTQDEVAESQNQVARRLAESLPVKIIP
ncbi:MAG TPA: phenylalanine--tRNA ligase subunit beta [Thermoanaerobaculia bacterium]